MFLARFRVADDTINKLILQNVSLENMGGLSAQELSEFGIEDESEQATLLE